MIMNVPRRLHPHFESTLVGWRSPVEVEEGEELVVPLSMARQLPRLATAEYSPLIVDKRGLVELVNGGRAGIRRNHPDVPRLSLLVREAQHHDRERRYRYVVMSLVFILGLGLGMALRTPAVLRLFGALL
jgi:hypothetical protein